MVPDMMNSCTTGSNLNTAGARRARLLVGRDSQFPAAPERPVAEGQLVTSYLSPASCVWARCLSCVRGVGCTCGVFNGMERLHPWRLWVTLSVPDGGTPWCPAGGAERHQGLTGSEWTIRDVPACASVCAVCACMCVCCVCLLSVPAVCLCAPACACCMCCVHLCVPACAQ